RPLDDALPLGAGERAGGAAADRVRAGAGGLAVDLQVELAGVVRRQADLVDLQRRLARIRDRADRVLTGGQRDRAGEVAVAADHGRVVGERRAGARRLSNRVGPDRRGDRAGRAAAGRIGAVAGRGTVDLQVELARVVRRHAHLVDRQLGDVGIRDRAGLAVAGRERDVAARVAVAADDARVVRERGAGTGELRDRVRADQVLLGACTGAAG